MTTTETQPTPEISLQQARRHGILVSRSLIDITGIKEAQATLQAEFGEAIDFGPIDDDVERPVVIVSRPESGRKILESGGSASLVVPALESRLESLPDKYAARSRTFKIFPRDDGVKTIALNLAEDSMLMAERGIAVASINRSLGIKSKWGLSPFWGIFVAEIVDASINKELPRFRAKQPINVQLGSITVRR